MSEKIQEDRNMIAWNHEAGSSFTNLRWGEWELKAVKYAIKAFNYFELDFGAVDIMMDNDRNCYVLEINSAPTLTSEYRQDCISKVFDYMINKGTERIQLTEELGGWRKFIHPAISDESIIIN